MDGPTAIALKVVTPICLAAALGASALTIGVVAATVVTLALVSSRHELQRIVLLERARRTQARRDRRRGR